MKTEVMKLQDYLHLYIGCEVVVCDLDGQVFNDRIEAVIRNKKGKAFSIYEFGDCYFDELEEYCQWIKPILRPLSDMTEEEAKKYFGLQANSEVYQKIHYEKHTEFLYRWEDDEVAYSTKDGKGYSGVGIAHNPSMTDMIPEQFLFLLSKHFDLFNLIENNLAIDKITLK